MNKKLENLRSAAEQIRFDEDATCDLCGRFGAFYIGGRTLCQDCYQGCGSCCPEFGKDDLWKFRDEISTVNSNSKALPQPEKIR